MNVPLHRHVQIDSGAHPAVHATHIYGSLSDVSTRREADYSLSNLALRLGVSGTLLALHSTLCFNGMAFN